MMVVSCGVVIVWSWTSEAALEVLRMAAGTQFDPALVPIFEEIVRAELVGVTG